MRGTPDMAVQQSAGARRSKGLWIWTGLALLLIAVGLAGFDRWFYEHVSRVLNTEDRPLDHDFYSLTKPFWTVCRFVFGNVLGALGLCAAVAILRPVRWRTVLVAWAIVAGVALTANVAQRAIGRLRPNRAESHLAFTQPFAELLTRPRVSFPSGEAATAFALACVLVHLVPRGQPGFYALATLTAGARLVNGAHYVSDVAAGALLGALLADVLFCWLGRTRAGPRANPTEPPGSA
ncbi:MAG: phosphatase PAP2 family protein [Phycisphaerae bacterium]|nr:phosphatase PAP2 family protein [Phycisphaerae bacterium]